MGRSDHLDEIFAKARAARDAAQREAPPDFLARVLEDALALQPAPAAIAPMVAPARRGFGAWLAEAFAALGGAGAVAGLATAALTGLWLGFAQPALVSGLMTGIGATETPMDSFELLPDADMLLTEG